MLGYAQQEIISPYLMPFIPASMPTSYLKLHPVPNQPIEDWLSWLTSKLEEKIAKDGSKIASLMGINKAADLQSLFMLVIVQKAFQDDALAIFENSTSLHREISFVFTYYSSDLF